MMPPDQLLPLLGFSLALTAICALAIVIVRDIRRGHTWWRGGGIISRNERPAAFWFFIALQTLLVVGGTLVALYVVYRAVTDPAVPVPADSGAMQLGGEGNSMFLVLLARIVGIIMFVFAIALTWTQYTRAERARRNREAIPPRRGWLIGLAIAISVFCSMVGWTS